MCVTDGDSVLPTNVIVEMFLKSRVLNPIERIRA